MFAVALVSCDDFRRYYISETAIQQTYWVALPWTICDEDTWNIAHSILGYISLPDCSTLYHLRFDDFNFEIVTICAMAAWVGIRVWFLIYSLKRK